MPSRPEAEAEMLERESSGVEEMDARFVDENEEEDGWADDDDGDGDGDGEGEGE